MHVIAIQPSTSAQGPLFDAARAPLEGIACAPGDIVLLPEHSYDRPDHEAYQRAVSDLAIELGCYVVGGSHHGTVGQQTLNVGAAFAPDGRRVGSYDKLRPYAAERVLVRPGSRFGEFRLGEVNALVLICADFWYADLLQQVTVCPDLILVPALSVTRKPTPAYSQQLWRHLAIARAYEFGCYVAISDWAAGAQLGILPASGVGGFVDPTVVDPTQFFQPAGAAARFELDLPALRRFRSDRASRGFFWKKEDGAAL